MTSPEAVGLRARIARRWGAFSATQRRRIVLGALVGLALAGRDLLLLLVAAGLFALAELSPPATHRLRAST